MKLAHSIKVVASWLVWPLAFTSFSPILDTENIDAMPLGIALLICLLGGAVLALLVLAAVTLVQNHTPF